MQPPPNPEYTNWNEVWIPPKGFYCRGSLVSHEAAVKAAAQFAGVHSHHPICIGGAARLRQPHCVIPRGGTYADIAASHYTRKMAGGSFDHPLRFLATWGCSGKGFRHGAQTTIPLRYHFAVCASCFRGIHHDVSSCLDCSSRKAHRVLACLLIGAACCLLVCF